MKKVLSLCLAVLMAFTCLVPALAADLATFNDKDTVSAGTVVSGMIGSGVTVTISKKDDVALPTLSSDVEKFMSNGFSADNVVLVKNNDMLTVEGTLINNGILVIPADAKLVVSGSIMNTGVIINQGTIVNVKNIYNGERGSIYTQVIVPNTEKIPNIGPNEGPEGTRKYEVFVSDRKGYEIDDLFTNADPTGQKVELTLNDELFTKGGQTVYVKNDESVYLLLQFLINADNLELGEDKKIDPAKFVVRGNGVALPLDRGVYKIAPVDRAITITYGDYIEKNLLKSIKIPLPSGKGYRVVAYGVTLEEATEENIEFAYVDYGSNLNFRIEVFEGYKNSDITVTVGGLDPTVQPENSYVSGPDKFGYYTIKNITDEDAADGKYEINVVGIVPDETANMIMTIMNTIRRIFETISDIFKTFIDMFRGLGQ